MPNEAPANQSPPIASGGSANAGWVAKILRSDFRHGQRVEPSGDGTRADLPPAVRRSCSVRVRELLQWMGRADAPAEIRDAANAVHIFPKVICEKKESLRPMDERRNKHHG